MNTIILSAKSPQEIVSITVPFRDRLLYGEAISGAATSVSVFSGIDPSPSTLISSPATYDASGNMYQVVTGGLSGVIYTLTFAVTGTGSHTYLKAGQLSVISPEQEYS